MTFLGKQWIAFKYKMHVKISSFTLLIFPKWLKKSFSQFLLLSLSLTLFVPASSANLFANQSKNRILSVEEAFTFDFSQKEQELNLNWQILPGYYLYQAQIQLDPLDSKISEFDFPESITHKDEFFGEVQIYRDKLNLLVPLLETSDNPALTVTYQGCADIGICYPPKTITIPLKTLSTQTKTEKSEQVSSEKTLAKTSKITIEESAQQTPEEAKFVDANLPDDQKNQLGFSVWWALLLGLGVAFTPCVLPMYPLIVGIIGGQNRPKSTLRMSALVFSYIQGMALSYTVLGVVIALAGLQFQAALQHPVLLGSIAILFVLLAGSMFGFYTLQMPSSIQTRLVNWSDRQQGGSLIGVFFMGAIAGLLCSPCTTAPLTAILLYIAKSGDLFLGGTALYLYAIGMGIPLVLFTLFGNKLLPKAGAWMQYIKEGFGFIILALPVFLLERFISTELSEWLWSLLLVAVCAWAVLSVLRYTQPFARLMQVLLLIVLMFAAWPFQQLSWQALQNKLPIFSTSYPTTSNNLVTPDALQFIDIEDKQTLSDYLDNAKSVSNQTVLIDFYADWCTACKQFEKYTFSDPDVQKALENTLLVRVDVTKNSPENQALLEQYQILGLPALLLIDKTGKEVERISGFLDAQNFLTVLQEHFEHI